LTWDGLGSGAKTSLRLNFPHNLKQNKLKKLAVEAHGGQAPATAMTANFLSGNAFWQRANDLTSHNTDTRHTFDFIGHEKWLNLLLWENI